MKKEYWHRVDRLDKKLDNIFQGDRTTTVEVIFGT